MSFSQDLGLSGLADRDHAERAARPGKTDVLPIRAWKSPVDAQLDGCRHEAADCPGLSLDDASSFCCLGRELWWPRSKRTGHARQVNRTSSLWRHARCERRNSACRNGEELSAAKTQSVIPFASLCHVPNPRRHSCPTPRFAPSDNRPGPTPIISPIQPSGARALSPEC